MWKRLCLGSSENLVVFSWCHLQGWQAWDVCLHWEKEGSKEFKSWLSLVNSVWCGWFHVAGNMGLMYRYEAMVSRHTTNLGQSEHPAFPWALEARSVSCSQCQPPDFDMQGLWLCWMLGPSRQSVLELLWVFLQMRILWTTSFVLFSLAVELTKARPGPL